MMSMMIWAVDNRVRPHERDDRNLDAIIATKAEAQMFAMAVNYAFDSSV